MSAASDDEPTKPMAVVVVIADDPNRQIRNMQPAAICVAVLFAVGALLTGVLLVCTAVDDASLVSGAVALTVVGSLGVLAWLGYQSWQ